MYDESHLHHIDESMKLLLFVVSYFPVSREGVDIFVINIFIIFYLFPGLVAISASCSVVDLGGALAIGVFASILCTFMSCLLSRFHVYSLNIQDIYHHFEFSIK